MKKRLPKGIRKYIRCQKSRVRRVFLDIKKQEEEIDKVYQRFYSNINEGKNRDISKPNKGENGTG